jgi:asparagine synthase (glutamine-hydrolysing)
MCGLVGMYDPRRRLGEPSDFIEDATTALRHRGPDSSGTWISGPVALGHRRLAVIDPEHGHQPWITTAQDERVVALVHSGEIYNFASLRRELECLGHVFRSGSDTEVVARSYVEWGLAAVERFEGMFAFALWDDAKQELWLVRDRLGIKPLYYMSTDGGVLFASEIKGLLCHPSVKPRTTTAMLPLLFNQRLGLPGEVPLQGVRQVKPGGVVHFTEDGSREFLYWQLTEREHSLSPEETADRLRSMLCDTVARQIVADRPVAGLLSGGIDSSLLCAMGASAMGSDTNGLKTYSLGFRPGESVFVPTALRPEDDTQVAPRVAQDLGLEHAVVDTDLPSLLAVAEASGRARDLPSLGQFDQTVYLLFQKVRESAVVVLSGEGADEILGGYPWLVSPGKVGTSEATFPWLEDSPRLSDCLSDAVWAEHSPRDDEFDRFRTLEATAPIHAGGDGDPADRAHKLASYLSLQGPLQYLLDRKDRMSMAVGLEVRVPFCDHKVVEFCFNIPASMKLAAGDKTVLRDAARGLVPEYVRRRRKSAYPALQSHQYERLVANSVVELLDDPGSPLRPYLDQDRTLGFVDGNHASTTHAGRGHFLTPLLEVDRWMRHYDIDMTN